MQHLRTRPIDTRTEEGERENDGAGNRAANHVAVGARRVPGSSSFALKDQADHRIDGAALRTGRNENVDAL